MNTEAIGSSRMRTALAAIVALALLMMLFTVDNASAQSLSSKRATKMANSLLDKQLKDKERRLIEARITLVRRVNRRVIRFLYDDLNRQGVVCTGTIEVRRTGRRFRASFRATSCKKPGDETLAFRAQSRVVAVRFTRKEASVRRAIARYTRDTEACENLRIPDDRVDEATLLLSTGLLQATTRPLFGTLDDYSATLQALESTEAPLIAGAAAWKDFSDTVQALPVLEGGYCGALAAWGRNGYTDETAPVDFAALRTIATRLRADGAEVRRTARYLRTKGVDAVTANAFTLDDLIGVTAISDNPDEVGD